MSASPDPKEKIKECITSACGPRDRGRLETFLNALHGETTLDLHLFALKEALALNVLPSKSHSDLLHTVLKCLLENCRDSLARDSLSAQILSDLLSKAVKKYESEDEWRAKLLVPGVSLREITNPTPRSDVCSSPTQSPASAPSGQSQPDSSCQQPPSHARLSATLSLYDNSLSEPPPELLLRQTVPELEEVLSAANIDAADVNAIGDSLVGILALARAHCLGSHARKLARPFGGGDEAERLLFHKAHGEERPMQLWFDEPQLCLSVFTLFLHHLAPVLALSHALKGFTLFGCAAPQCTAVILRRYRSNCAGPPPSVCKLPRHRYREPRKKGSAESGNVAADALFLLVKTDGDEPCCVDCHVYESVGMFDALVLKLEELSKNNNKLTSVFVLEAKAVTPTRDKIVPHINCIVDQGFRYWSNLKKTLKDKQSVAKILGETIPVLVGANFGAPQKDIATLTYDVSRGREVKTAFGYVAQAAAESGFVF